MKQTFVFFLLVFAVKFTAQNAIVPGFSVSISSEEAKGFYFFSPIKIGHNGVATLPVNVIIDEKGNLVYYKKFSKGPFAGNFRLLTNGLMTYQHSNKFYLMDSAFVIKDTIVCVNGIQQEPREFFILPNGHYVLLGSETIKMDLSEYPFFNHKGLPGDTAANVKCDVIQELDSNKHLVFEWRSKHHNQFNTVDAFFMSNPKDVDWQHSNAIAIDKEGDYYLSVKHFNEITKISRKDGHIIWHLGGKKNQFHFINDPDMFKGQHGIYLLPNSNILVYDNGRGGKTTHPEGAKEYKLDENKRIAKLVWSHIPNKNYWSSGYGNVQRLSNGNTLVSFGRCDDSNLLFNVTKPNGKKIFELVTDDSLRNYRTYYYQSLPFKMKRPKITCVSINNQWFLQAQEGYNSYSWSNGQTDRNILLKEKGIYFVCVLIGDGGNICSETLEIEDPQNPEKGK